jgi:hypothetical protein
MLERVAARFPHFVGDASFFAGRSGALKKAIAILAKQMATDVGQRLEYFRNLFLMKLFPKKSPRKIERQWR